MNNIRKYRERAKLTQEELAKKIGSSSANISNYECGKREANYETLLKLSEALDCSVDDLIGSKNYIPNSSNGMKLPSDIQPFAFFGNLENMSRYFKLDISSLQTPECFFDYIRSMSSEEQDDIFMRLFEDLDKDDLLHLASLILQIASTK